MGQARYLRQYVADPSHGPLIGLLLVLTFTTGVLDAVAILRLGHVFIGNMTGNTIFVGLAVIQAPGFLLDASLVVLAAFLAGLVLGRLILARRQDRAGLLRLSTTVQSIIVLVALLVTAFVDDPIPAGPRNAALACLGFACGVQNAAVAKLKVPDETTSVVTRTLATLVVGWREVPPSTTLRRLLSVLTLLAGGICGGIVVLHAGLTAALSIVVVLQLAVVAVLAAASRRPAQWRDAGTSADEHS